MKNYENAGNKAIDAMLIGWSRRVRVDRNGVD